MISNQVKNVYNYSENTMSSTCISPNSLSRQLKVSPVPQISSNVNSGHSSDTFIHTQDHPISLNLGSKGINIGHLNIQGICGENMSKFSELKFLLTARENCNLHILGLSETKLKDHKSRLVDFEYLRVWLFREREREREREEREREREKESGGDRVRDSNA